jgi:hypothetical protein
MCPFSFVRHANRPPNIAELLAALNGRNVHFVLVGSAAALSYGVEVEPGDVDIVPALDVGNLVRLVNVLTDLEASPDGPFGSWHVLDSGEWKFVSRPTSDEEISEWQPDVSDASSLDQLFVTRSGNLDIVPNIAGEYATLRSRAVRQIWNGREVHVAHIDDLLARMTVPRREKDRPRVTALREIQRRNGQEI